MKMIKITKPDGKEFIVPDSNNKTFYEKMNGQIKDPKKLYKIESAPDAEGDGYAGKKKPKQPTDAETAAKLEKAEADLATAQAAHAETAATLAAFKKEAIALDNKFQSNSRDLEEAKKQVAELEVALKEAKKELKKLNQA